MKTLNDQKQFTSIEELLNSVEYTATSAFQEKPLTFLERLRIVLLFTGTMALLPVLWIAIADLSQY